MSLEEIAELSWQHIFPAESKAPIPKESFIRTAFAEFAYQSLLMAWREGADDYYEVPYYLLTEVEKDVVDNQMDISDLKVFKSLPMQMWLQNIGGISCNCKYVKSSLNLAALLCDDDSMDDAARPYYPQGQKIIFPKGVHKTPLKIIYANMGEGINGKTEVDEAIGSLIRDKLDAIYLGKVPPVDTTNNQNPNVTQ